MKWPWSKPRSEGDGPNPDKARAELEQIRRRRVEVERLVHALRTDRAENHYGRNVETIFRGGKSA